MVHTFGEHGPLEPVLQSLDLCKILTSSDFALTSSDGVSLSLYPRKPSLLSLTKRSSSPLSSTFGILPLAWLHLRILLQNVLEQWYLCRLHFLPSLPQRFPSLPKCSTVEAPLQDQSHLIIPQPQQQGPPSLPLPFFRGSRIQPSGSRDPVCSDIYSCPWQVVMLLFSLPQKDLSFHCHWHPRSIWE